MILGIHHVAMSTPNLARLVAFYRDLMGFKVVYEGAWPVGTTDIDSMVGLRGSSARLAMLRSGGCHLEIFEYASPPPQPSDPNRPVNDHGYTHFCVAVDDIDREYERLTAAGMKFHCAPARKEGKIHRATYGRDPDGNVVELLQVIAKDHPFAPVQTVEA
jgi:catechol 2,3-dioxygenase-like lactoylglutathione lyase family enzyme